MNAFIQKIEDITLKNEILNNEDRDAQLDDANSLNQEKYNKLIGQRDFDMSEVQDELVKITSGGTISLPKQFRKYLEMQKGDYVKIGLEGDHLVVRKVIIS